MKRIISVLLCMALLFGVVPVLSVPAQAAGYKLYFNSNVSSEVDVYNMPPTMTGQSQYEIPACYYSEDDGAVHDGVPTRYKYTFLGWSEDSNASTPDYVPGNTIILSKNTTLYAVWKSGISSAQTITWNGSLTVITDFPGQEKWVRIRLDSNADYWSKSGASQIWSAAEGDPEATLYDADGYYLEWNDNSSLGYDDLNFRIPYTFSKSTTYYLSVTTDFQSSVYDDQTETYMPEAVVVNLDKIQNRYNAKFYDNGSLRQTIALFDDYPGKVPSYGLNEEQSLYIDNFLGWSTWSTNSGNVLYPGDDLVPKNQTLTSELEEWDEVANGVVCGTVALLSFGRQIRWYSFTPITSGTYHILLWASYNMKCSLWEGVESKINDVYPTYNSDSGLNDYSVYLQKGKTYYVGVRPMIYFEGPNDMEYIFEICRAATLSYDANGGSGGPSSQSGAYEYTIPSTKPTRSGYAFAGWSTTPDNEDDFCYQPGGLVEVNAAATLYAQWSRIGKPPYWGDVNGDNKINSLDITLISKYIADLETLTAEQACFGDVNLDGKTNISDATTIAQYIAGTISAFLCESVADITVIPAKTQYTKGEALKTSGTRILVKNRNSSVSYELTDNISISGYNPNTVGTQTLTASYRGLKLTFTVTVNDTTYSLSYNANGGSPTPETQTGAQTYTISSTIPKKIGYTFLGWSKDSSASSATYLPGDKITLTADTTLYAVWKSAVSMSNGSSFTTPITIKGQSYFYKFEPTASYTYVIYSTGSADTEVALYNASGVKLSSNDDGGSGTNFRLAYALSNSQTYYYEVKYHSSTTTGNITVKFGEVYQIYYSANGGSGAPDPQLKDWGTDITVSSLEPTTPKSYIITYNANGGTVSPTSKTVNCTFNSWNTDPLGSGTSYDKGQVYSENIGRTFHAKWTNPTAGTLPTPSRSGYTFDGWYTSSSGGSKVTSGTTITENKTLYAHWIPNVYTVRFNGNGATSGSMSNQSFTYDTAQNLKANAFSRSYTVTYNYNGATSGNTSSTATAAATFNGWATSAGGSKVYDNQQSVKNLVTNGIYDLYANWTLGTVTLPRPQKTGYSFGGWYANSALTTFAGNAGASYKPTANVTLYAKWTPNPVNNYTVIFDTRGGAVSPSSITVPSGTSITLPTPSKNYTISFNPNGGSVSQSTSTVNCKFQNWNTNSSGTGTSFSAGARYPVSANTTLYAQWTNPTAGTLPTPSRSGYTFDGWYTSSSGGSKVTSGTMITGNTTLYAHWTRIPVYTTGCDLLSPPAKTTYIYKESTNVSGIVLRMRYSDGTTKDVSDTSQMTFSGLSTSSIGTKTVMVTCEGEATSFQITVRYAWWQQLIRIFLFGWLWY